MSITLQKNFVNSITYVADHGSNYTLIETQINNLLSTLGATSGGSLSVPLGLKEIFDRDGVIGIGSYKIISQTLVGELLPVTSGAAILNSNFLSKTTSSNVDLNGLASGTLFLNIDTSGNPTVSTSSSSSSIYSFNWNDTTKVISLVTLITQILFDGDDYNDSLSSTTLSTSYLKLSDRLEDIESRLGILGSFYTEDISNHSGLSFAFRAGKVRNDTLISDTASGSILLNGSTANNYIEVNPSTGIVSTNVSGFTSNFIPLFRVTTTINGFSLIDDKRTWASLGGGGGGGGGGHTQNTDIGTNNTRFDLLQGQLSGLSNAAFGVDRGVDPTVDIRWNETTNEWEFTNDGSIYSGIGNLDLGSQELSKLVMIDNPPIVLNVANINTGASYTLVDITNIPELSSVQQDGVSGLILRVIYWDSSASLTTNVRFRNPINPSMVPLVAYNVQASTTGQPNEQQLTTIIMEGEGFDASNTRFIGFDYLATTSGTSTGNLTIYLTGFFAKVTGVGTQDKTFISASNTVLASSTVNFNLLGFVNRGLIHRFYIEETSGSPLSVYNIKVYSEDTFTNVLYQIDSIDPTLDPFIDTLPFFYYDSDSTSELHISIENTSSLTGTYKIIIRSEQFN